MGRRPRVHYHGAFYHVINRGNQGQRIFKDKADFRLFQLLVRDAQRQFGFKLYAYVLMPNHFHALIQISQRPLSKVMQSVLYRYTRYYNQRYHKAGHLFQGRYKAILCDKESYLLELVRYIHLNPVRAQMVTDPKTYPWSSHRMYLEGKATQEVAVEEILSQWSKRRRQAIVAYEEFVLDGIKQGHREDFFQVKEQRYLGDVEFAERVEEKVEQNQKERPVRITLDEIVKEIASRYKKAEGEIRSKRRGRKEAMLRALACYVGREIGGIKLADSSRYFVRDISGLSVAVRNLEQKILGDKAFHRQISDVCLTLRKARRAQ